MEEIWKDVPGYESIYQVSNLGRVRRKEAFVKCGNRQKKIQRRILKPQETTQGYWAVNLSICGVAKAHRIHRLVAKAFIPNPESKREVNHLDLNKKNNNVNNLSWATPKENVQHAFSSGAIVINNPHGERARNAKLKLDDVLEIRRIYSSGKSSLRKLGRQYGVCYTNIAYIVKNKSWKPEHI